VSVREVPIATPRNMFPTDSWEFAVITMRLLTREYEYRNHSIEDFERRLKEIEEYRIYDRLPDPDSPYGSLDAMLQAELGATEHQAREIKTIQQRTKDTGETIKPIRESRRPTREEQKNGKYNNIIVNQGTSAKYLAARIARDRPDILEEMKAGKYRSVRAAAIDAGIVKVPTSLESAQKAFLKLSKDERETFLIWVSEQ